MDSLQLQTVEVWQIDEAGMYVEAFKDLRLTKAEFEAYKAKPGRWVKIVPDERFDSFTD